VPFLRFDREIRTVICTTNAIESINARLRRAVNARGHFPTEQAALKCLYLAITSLDRPAGAASGGPTGGRPPSTPPTSPSTAASARDESNNRNRSYTVILTDPRKLLAVADTGSGQHNDDLTLWSEMGSPKNADVLPTIAG
jgi:Transposase, Mutator family